MGIMNLKETIAFLLSNEVEADNLKSLMLEFLRFAGYNTPININKMNYSVNVILMSLMVWNILNLKLK